MEELTVCQFYGEGRGFLQGVTEYFRFTTAPEAEDREPAPGFKLVGEWTIDVPSALAVQLEGGSGTLSRILA